MPQRSLSRFFVLCSGSTLLPLLCVISSVIVVQAEPQLITAEGEYRLSDHDTKEDAMRLAVEAAKRHALEQVATYVESISVTNGLELTRDEIRSYTAGVVEVTHQTVTTRLDGEAIVFHADITARLDPDEVLQAAQGLRGQDEARQQVTLLHAEVQQLQQQLTEATEKLTAATTAEQIYFAGLERQELLNRAESDAVLARAWTSLAYGPAVTWATVQALWGQASMWYPANPHLVVLQRHLPVVMPSASASRLAAPAGVPTVIGRSSASHPPAIMPSPRRTVLTPNRLTVPVLPSPNAPTSSWHRPERPHRATVAPHSKPPRMGAGKARGRGRR